MKKTKLDLDIEKDIQNDPSLKEEIAKANRAIDISIQVYTLRKERKLTQSQLAELIGVSQPNVARLENADYGSYTLQTLEKIASALSAYLSISLKPKEESTITFSASGFLTMISPVFVAGGSGQKYVIQPSTTLQINSLPMPINDVYEKVQIDIRAEKNSENLVRRML